MSIHHDPRLLTPPPEEEEVYPYRSVWRSVIIESGLLLLIVVGVFVLANVFHVQIPNSLRLPFDVGVALLPLGLWLYFSRYAERTVPEPRERLLAVLIISGLAANAIGIPFVNDYLKVDSWLPLGTAIGRIIGYTFTVGIVQETLKYLVIRFVAWPDQFRIRIDGAAYGVAAAVGYATVVNLGYVFSSSATFDVTAMHVFATFAMHIASTVIVGYGLSEIWFGSPTPLQLPITLGMAAFITGLAIPVRAGLVNASFSLKGIATRPLFGLIFSAVLLGGVLFVIAFLFQVSERRAREAAISLEG